MNTLTPASTPLPLLGKGPGLGASSAEGPGLGATLTPHFFLSEFTRSATARALGLDNTPPASAVANLRHLCERVLEPLRQWYGRPIRVSSGFRSPPLNKAVGGASGSLHMTGCAADLVVDRQEDLRLLYLYIRNHLPHTELLLEQRSGARWIHVGLS